MIEVKRLNGEALFINPHLIELIEATPDTVLTLTTGKRYVVREGAEEVVAKIIEYRQRIGAIPFVDGDGGGVEAEGVDPQPERKSL